MVKSFAEYQRRALFSGFVGIVGGGGADDVKGGVGVKMGKDLQEGLRHAETSVYGQGGGAVIKGHSADTLPLKGMHHFDTAARGKQASCALL